MRQKIKITGSLQIVLALLISALALSGYASAPKVGKSAAARYFQGERNAERRGVAASEESSSLSSNKLVDHFMSLGFGTFSDGTSYNWGLNGKETQVGKWGVDLSYRFTEQEYLFDAGLRVSYNNYGPANQEASKLSFLYAMTFPEATSRFPLYFGIAAGPGFYTKQVSDESVIALDYQLYLGVRAFNLFDAVGLYIEGGMRNHLHLTSDGQFNGTFLSLGTVFNF